jgi:hypothetical protein
MGAAASPTCSADCAARLDQARRLKLAGRRAVAGGMLNLSSDRMDPAYEVGRARSAPVVAIEFSSYLAADPVVIPSNRPHRHSGASRNPSLRQHDIGTMDPGLRRGDEQRRRTP